MMRVLAVVVALAACKERGTIEVPLVEACTGQTPTSVAIYLRRGVSCASVACGLVDFECKRPNCTASCSDQPDGYCAYDQLEGIQIEPPSGGDYALVMTFRYAEGALDEGLACFELEVDADGTQTKLVTDAEGSGQCCMRP